VAPTADVDVLEDRKVPCPCPCPCRHKPSSPDIWLLYLSTSQHTAVKNYFSSCNCRKRPAIRPRVAFNIPTALRASRLDNFHTYGQKYTVNFLIQLSRDRKRKTNRNRQKYILFINFIRENNLQIEKIKHSTIKHLCILNFEALLDT
jgi:hypothetical protein